MGLLDIVGGLIAYVFCIDTSEKKESSRYSYYSGSSSSWEGRTNSSSNCVCTRKNPDDVMTKYPKPFNYGSWASKLPNRYSVSDSSYRSGYEKMVAKAAWRRDNPNKPYPPNYDYF